MMIYIRWSVPLPPPAWVVSWACGGEPNNPYFVGRQFGVHERIFSAI